MFLRSTKLAVALLSALLAGASGVTAAGAQPGVPAKPATSAAPTPSGEHAAPAGKGDRAVAGDQPVRAQRSQARDGKGDGAVAGDEPASGSGSSEQIGDEGAGGTEPADATGARGAEQPVGDTAPAAAPVGEGAAAGSASPSDTAAAGSASPSDSAAAKRAREQAERATHEREQPRPALPDIAAAEPPRWRRHLEMGGDFAVVVRPFANGLDSSSIGYNPAVGWGVHLRWPIFDWLRFHAYFLDAHHGLDIPQGALVAPTSVSISSAASVDTTAVETFSFGGRLAPTWPLTERLRAWVSVGIGWGRFNFPVMTVTEPGGHAYEVQDRSGVFVEFPLGLGASFDVIERWLAIELESTIAPVTGQSGDAYQVFQAIDADGQIADVGPFGAIEASFVNTVGLSLIL